MEMEMLFLGNLELLRLKNNGLCTLENFFYFSSTYNSQKPILNKVPMCGFFFKLPKEISKTSIQELRPVCDFEKIAMLRNKYHNLKLANIFGSAQHSGKESTEVSATQFGVLIT
jgi:hypothetical protein